MHLKDMGRFWMIPRLSKPVMKGVLAPPNIGSQRHGRRLAKRCQEA